MAMTAEQFFDDGNRLYRDDLYWAALLRYRQATEAGMDTPLLHYNAGIAHYKAGQHIRARESLLKALDSPNLRIPAQYNLGLNAYAAGDLDEALRWFRLARDQQQKPRIADYASIAIARINKSRREIDPVVVREAEERRIRELTRFSFRGRVGFGSDSNAFRSPSEPYIDFADPALPLVTPEAKEGAFMPLSLSAKYQINALRNEGFYGAYRLAGRYYQDKELENGNEYIHELSFGSEYDRIDEEANRRRELYSAFRIAQHDEVYYDPDDGGSRIVNGVPIDDRMNYLRYGPEVLFRQSHERLSLGFRLKGQLWNYEDVEQVPEYDHEFFLVGATAQYRFTRTSLLRLVAETYSRRYGERPSFDLDGNQIIGAPPARYDYLDLGVVARQRILDGLWFGVEYRRTDREDRYLGYNDYTRDSYGAEIHWSVGRRFDLEASGWYRLYNYPRAFAFHNPVAGRKTLESADLSVVATFRMTQSLSLVLEGSFRERVSNDTRIAYERTQYLLGVRWEP